jgi:hypothetical protein
MQPVFAAYCLMLERFPVELVSGRSYGVVTVPWSSRSEDGGKARLMQERATEAAAAARKGIEELLNGGKPKPGGP